MKYGIGLQTTGLVCQLRAWRADYGIGVPTTVLVCRLFDLAMPTRAWCADYGLGVPTMILACRLRAWCPDYGPVVLSMGLVSWLLLGGLNTGMVGRLRAWFATVVLGIISIIHLKFPSSFGWNNSNGCNEEMNLMFYCRNCFIFVNIGN